MRFLPTLSVLLLLLPLPAAADDDGRKEGEGLVVEKVAVNGADAGGAEIEVYYRLVGVERLPGHPSKTTLIMDEASKQGVMLNKLQALASPVSAEEAEHTPAAILTFRDERGVIKPGSPVSVAVAGLVQKHVVPEAGPGYRALDEARAEAEADLLESVPPDATLEVYEAKLTGSGGLLQVRFKTNGIKELSAAAENTYVLDPETGERFRVLRVPRIGLMAPKHLGEYEAGSYMVVRTPTGKIKSGQHVTVVVEGLHRDVVVE